MKKRLFMKFFAGLLACSMVVSLTACSGTGELKSKNLMKEVDSISCGDEDPEDLSAVITDFSARLFQNSIKEGENTLISPLSVLVALSMTGNGANGQTLSQMEETFGEDIVALNVYLRDYMNKLPQGEKYKLQLANSIWFTNKESFTVNQDFLQKNATYYGADIYASAFDETTLKDINLWVEQKTDGMIKDILNEIPDEAIMYLINALAFEAEWADTYDESQVRKKTFTTEEGEEQSVNMMFSDESLYLENDQMTGFIKYYSGQKYAFAALLPNEGESIADCVKELTGNEIRGLLENPKQVHVNAAIPEFETEYEVLMNDILGQMGMIDAFSPVNADFSGLGTSTEGNIFINRVIHKTYIEVGPQGTKAGAATVVEMMTESAAVYEESKTVYLDRPFIYMLIDCESNQPFFMGTCMNVE